MIPTLSVKTVESSLDLLTPSNIQLNAIRGKTRLTFNVNGRVKVMKITVSPLLSHQSSLITEMILKHGIFLLNQSTQ